MFKLGDRAFCFWRCITSVCERSLLSDGLWRAACGGWQQRQSTRDKDSDEASVLEAVSNGAFSRFVTTETILMHCELRDFSQVSIYIRVS